MDRQKKVSLWWAKNFRPLVVALLVGCGVHYTIYANQLGTMDAVHIGALYIADGWPEHLYWETEQGRWALRLVDMLRGGINQPALSALLMLFLYALAGVLLTDLFGVRSRTAKYLIPLTLVCAPYVAEIEFFHYCSVSYALSFLLAVLAVQSAVCGLRFAWLAGTVCMAFSLGMYQANLGTAAGLCVMLLILAVLLRGFAVQVNNDAAVMLKQKTTVVNLANRLCTRLEENADYQNGAEVVILGEPKRGAYPEESPLKPMAGELAQFGPLSYDPTFNAHGWYVLVWDELGVQLNECADETVRAISNSDAFKAMPNYPADGCIQTIDGVVTLKVADFPF